MEPILRYVYNPVTVSFLVTLTLYLCRANSWISNSPAAYTLFPSSAHSTWRTVCSVSRMALLRSFLRAACSLRRTPLLGGYLQSRRGSNALSSSAAVMQRERMPVLVIASRTAITTHSQFRARQSCKMTSLRAAVAVTSLAGVAKSSCRCVLKPSKGGTGFKCTCASVLRIAFVPCFVR